ncbi:MAG TPA: [acyl-carrier-protein] S-malonyltransferase [Lentisphaeria bacterium]|nr:MAG: [acyl-carrier-protein] S-malonyltransferase [Lentisphaerae bacterium GWF2_49_21]HBC89089.1 [acyl-carrier-protein] S-malonyltransferase [Lentisphaeria bacterium]
MKPVFVFSGQGAQAVGMGKDLFEQSPAAAAVFKEADSILGWSVSDLCFNGPEAKLTESRYCQPSIYTMSSACLAAFSEKKPEIKALASAGLSLGEFAALYSAGAFSFADGLRLVAKRAELMDECCKKAKGGMATILGGDPSVIRQICQECDIDVANLNCPGQVVVSGSEEKVTKAVSVFKEKGFKKVIPLKVAGAYHSRMMKDAGEALKPVLEGIPMKDPMIPVAQNYVGTCVKSVCEIRSNLVSQVAGSVKWEECVKAILSTGADTVIEFGPGNVLTGLAKRINANVATYNINSMDSVKNFV